MANDKFRLPFPEHLLALRRSMVEMLPLLESGRESEWYAFLWLEESHSRSVALSRVESLQQTSDRGLVARIVACGVNYEFATNRLDDLTALQSELKQFRRRVERAIEQRESHGRNDHDFRYQPPVGAEWLSDSMLTGLDPDLIAQIEAQRLSSRAPGPPSELHFSPLIVEDPRRETLASLKTIAQDYRRRALALDEKYRADRSDAKPLADLRLMVRQTVRTHIFIDRIRNMSQTLPISLIYPVGISASGFTGRSPVGGMGGFEVARPGQSDLEEAVVLPHRLEKAKRITPGRFRVITGPDVTGVIAHEAFGHTQEGDTCLKGRSIADPLRERREQVGNDQASIVNYATLFDMEGREHGTNGSLFFDHEGNFSRPHLLLDRGYLQQPMSDLISSIRLGIPLSGNGKRESWRRPLMVRQTNTWFTPGDSSFEELLRLCGDGFLARYAHGGMEDPKGGSLTAGSEYFEEIRDGRLTGEIYLGPSGGHVELSDPVFDLLGRIVARSSCSHPRSFPENRYGGCGKYHKELVDAGCGGPWILWESVNCG